MPSYKDKKTGKWYCQFYYRDELTGKNKHKVKRGFDKKKDADAWEKDFLSQQYFDESLTMDNLIAEYIKNLHTLFELESIKATTLETKIKHINIYVLPYFKNILVKNIKTKDVNNWLENIQSSKRKKLSSRTLNNAKMLLSQIFKYAIVNHGFKDNPVTNAETIRFRSNDERAPYWTVEQYKLFYDNLQDETYKVFFNLLYWSGLRLGEALALTKNDITPYKINIDKTMVKFKNEFYISTPKTSTSIRTVEIPENLYYQIKNYMDRLYIYDTDRIFELNPQTVRIYLYSKCEKLNLPKISPHILRHSYASLLYNKSKDILVVAKQIGHKNPSITYEVYSHMLPGEDRKAIEAINSLETIDI